MQLSIYIPLLLLSSAMRYEVYIVNEEGNEKEMAIHFQIKIPYSIDKRET